MARYGRAQIDIGLRAAGLALVCGAGGIARVLHALALAHPNQPGVGELVMAAVLFLCASIGCALLFTGSGIFDRIKIASRWRRTPQFPVHRAVEPEWIAAEEVREMAES